MPVAIAAQALSVTHAMQRKLQARRSATVDHNHLFFLNHHTVNPVESNVIAIANS